MKRTHFAAAISIVFLLIIALSFADGTGTAESAPKRVVDAKFTGTWERQDGGDTITLEIVRPDRSYCGNSFLGSKDGVFFGEHGQANHLVPLDLAITIEHIDRFSTRDGPGMQRRSSRLDGYLIRLDDQIYLGLAELAGPTFGEGGYGRARHRWHKVQVVGDELRIDWSYAVVYWIEGAQALEDAGATLKGQPGSTLKPNLGVHVTGSLQRYADFHRFIHAKAEFWSPTEIWSKKLSSTSKTDQ